MNKNVLISASSLMLVSIVMGALGAHALEKILSVDELKSFKTATLFLSTQSLSLLVLCIIEHISKHSFKMSLRLILIGVSLFSFSIFLLLFLKHISFSGFTRIFGPITPIGGILMITGWVSVVFTLLKFNTKP